ncbi:MAG TPA: 5'-nucleotidase, lipoprotein e(P4) family [Sediminibacterium sp.]|nr:5'-nucleotidase, lipoprotein e(P4) family [Sediminibacterium sp.]
MKKFSVSLLIAATACSSPKSIDGTAHPIYNPIASAKLFTAAYEQKAAEYQALCLQAYNIARLRLDQDLKKGASAKPRAVVTDIDETILDNSPYAVHQALQGKDYTLASWTAWTSRGDADTLAGALTFFKYAAAHQVEIFYITNREEKERVGTLANLKKYGFPDADEAHLLTRAGTSSKEARRHMIAATHEIVLLLGDNLADFTALFDGNRPMTERTMEVRSIASDFGKKFIVLPNANYGDWEGALYQYHYQYTPQQKDSAIRSVLKNER